VVEIHLLLLCLAERDNDSNNCSDLQWNEMNYRSCIACAANCKAYEPGSCLLLLADSKRCNRVKVEKPERNCDAASERLFIKLRPDLRKLLVFFIRKLMHAIDVVEKNLIIHSVGLYIFKLNHGLLERVDLVGAPDLACFSAVAFQILLNLLKVLDEHFVNLSNILGLGEERMEDTNVREGERRF
jgi:hypothetical protein